MDATVDQDGDKMNATTDTALMTEAELVADYMAKGWNKFDARKFAANKMDDRRLAAAKAAAKLAADLKATPDSERVLIVGDTYPIKAKIADLGGKWDAARKGWMVPAVVADQIRAMLPAAKPVVMPYTCSSCGCGFSLVTMKRGGYVGTGTDRYCGC